MKTVAIIQARTSSTRLPGKVLLPLAGRPMIVFMLDRVRRSRLVDEIVVATSTDPSDDVLARCVAGHGVACHRGSLDDVLDRFHGAAVASNADRVVRLTGDCPLMDADLVDLVVARLAAGDVDYASNIAPPSFPDGLDVEAFTMAALERAASEARLRSDREHVTPYIRKAENGFRMANVTGIADMSELRWTVDYPDDFRLVESLVAGVRGADPVAADRFDFYRVLETSSHLREFNQHGRNEGYAKSLEGERP